MNFKRIVIAMFLLTLFVFAKAGTQDVFFTTTPSLSPDAKKIAFSYEGDIWIVNSDGGNAFRLTAMDGNESYPRFSPDGKWIAFSGFQNGNRDIYVVPVEGGEIKQLTFHEASDIVDSWSWDSKYIYFTSDRTNYFTEYKVSREGGTPQRLFENYFNTVHGVVELPKTTTYYFTDSWESYRFPNRKGYKGDNNPDIKSYDPQTKIYKQLTTYNGKDLWPTIDKHGNVYYVSDRDNGEYNLYRFENDKEVRLTLLDASVKTPQVSSNGEKVVFEKDYRLYTYNTQTQKVEKVNIDLYQNDTLTTEQDFNVAGKITYFDVSPDGKKFAFVSRGELFVSDVKGKFIRKLEIEPENRVVEVKWLKDSKTIVFTRTFNGWLNLFKTQSDKNDKEEQLTFDEANNRNIALNNEKTEALYFSGATKLNVIDLKTFKSRTVATDEIWGYQNSQPNFSPDGNYIVYTAYRNLEQDIFVVNLKTNQTANFTDSGVSEIDPSWSPDGKYIYFSCDRYNPSYPRDVNQSKIYRLPLQKYMDPFKSAEFDKLFKEEDKTKPGVKTEKTPEINFDYDEMARRWEKISPDPGNQFLPYVINQKDETTVLYISNHDGEKTNIWKTTLKPFEEQKNQKIEGTETGDMLISAASEKYYTLVNGKIGELDLGAGKFTPIAMSYTFRRNLKAEFNQMFYELWAGLDENYYDEKFHGIDWRKIKEKYKNYLPFIRSRSNLRTIIGDMLGELNSSHLGFTSTGSEEKTFYTIKSMEPGIIFEEQNPYKVKSLVKESPVDKKDIDIRPGDILIEVNGKNVDPSISRDIYFSAPSIDEEMTLTFKRSKEKEEQIYSIKIHPVSNRAFKDELYNEWIGDNQRRVDMKSNKRIAYIYMKDMGDEELDNFLVEMTTEAYKRDGLILDLRYNTGGNVHDAVLNFLSQRPYMVWKYRGGAFAPQPSFGPSVKPIVMLINEQSLSDAELTSTGFKELKLGKIIGTETYRWLIFTSGKGLVDGSFYRLPSWGCYSLDRKNIETNGVKPDIYIKNTFLDRIEGKDPQLDAAIDEIMKQLK